MNTTYDAFVNTIRSATHPILYDFYTKIVKTSDRVDMVKNDTRELVKILKKLNCSDLAKELEVNLGVLEAGLFALHELLIIQAHRIPWKKKFIDEHMKSLNAVFANIANGKICQMINTEWERVTDGTLFDGPFESIITVKEIPPTNNCFHLVDHTLPLEKIKNILTLCSLKIDSFESISDDKTKICVSDLNTHQKLKSGFIEIGPLIVCNV
jgi:hypothetical protein